MKTEMGEYIVGAYLKIIKNCDFIDYNVRLPGGGLRGLNELDVVGLDFKRKTAYLCEVTTHITGLLYKDKKTTVEKIKTKHKLQITYANEYLSDFPNKTYMFWSPVVSVGYITEGLKKIDDMTIIINQDYTLCINELRKMAKIMTNDAGNPFFRALQIIEHLKKI